MSSLPPRILFFMYASPSKFPFKSCEHEKFKEINKKYKCHKNEQTQTFSFFSDRIKRKFFALMR